MKKSIALSGGGDKISFLLGVIKKLYESGESYDYFAGVSSGSILLPFVVTGEIEKAKEVILNVGKSDILDDSTKFLNIIRSNYFATVEPLRKLLNKNITEDLYNRLMTSGKTFYIGTVKMNNMRSVYYTNCEYLKGNKNYDVEKVKSRKQFIRAIVSSSVQPILMRMELVNGELLGDGGMKSFCPLSPIIDIGCESITAILSNTGNQYYQQSDSLDKTIPALLKVIEIFSSGVAENDLRLAVFINLMINYIEEVKERIQRNAGWSTEKIESMFQSANNPVYNKKHLDLRIIRPLKELGGSGLDFDTEKMKEMFNYGYNML